MGYRSLSYNGFTNWATWHTAMFIGQDPAMARISDDMVLDFIRSGTSFEEAVPRYRRALRRAGQHTIDAGNATGRPPEPVLWDEILGLPYHDRYFVDQVFPPKIGPYDVDTPQGPVSAGGARDELLSGAAVYVFKVIDMPPIRIRIEGADLEGYHVGAILQDAVDDMVGGTMAGVAKSSPKSSKKPAKVLALARWILDLLEPEVDRLEIAGSIRGQSQYPEDIDVLVIGDPLLVQRTMNAMRGTKLLRHGERIQVWDIQGVQADVYFVTPIEWGAALMFLTGPNSYNIAYRRIAKRRGLRLNQYGLWDVKTGRRVAGKTEKSIYKVLGKKWKPPELRGA